MKAFEKFGKKPLFLGLAILLAPMGVYAQEYDDLYFTSKDRKEEKTVVTAKLDENSESNKVLSAYENDTYDGSSYSARNINPEYLSKYNNGVEEELVEESDEYFPEDYSSRNDIDNRRDFSRNDRYYDNAPIVNNYYNGFPGFCTFNPYAGGWGGSRVRVGVGYGTGFYGSGFSYSVSYGWGSPGWGSPYGYYSTFYDPFYDPFYSPFYGARYDPFYARYGYGYYPVYGSRYAFYSGYNRGFYNGYYYGGGRGEVVRLRNGREVVRGTRSSRTSYRGSSYGNTVGDSRVRESGRIERGDNTITRGRTRVNTTDISQSQNELGRSRTTETRSTRSRNAVTGTRSRESGSIDRSTYSSRSRNTTGKASSRERTYSSTRSRSRTSSGGTSTYERNYKSNSGGSYGSSRSRSYSSGSNSRSYGSSSGSRNRSSGFSSGGSRSRSSGFSSGGSRSRSSSGGGSSRSRSRSNN